MVFNQFWVVPLTVFLACQIIGFDSIEANFSARLIDRFRDYSARIISIHQCYNWVLLAWFGFGEVP
ncbi:hypothetical protein BOX37_07795 [Nocardia mangyaensis]|uniref:Uncharacterized protein n=1 Tax=Nocardia mangyaensis TaxID=2213200 RepID=A0A1J0VPC2_9NOCA|nr:hypothetical protein BOX37_07795 [Nocardia mangyaensis]